MKSISVRVVKHELVTVVVGTVVVVTVVVVVVVAIVEDVEELTGIKPDVSKKKSFFHFNFNNYILKKTKNSIQSERAKLLSVLTSGWLHEKVDFYNRQFFLQKIIFNCLLI